MKLVKRSLASIGIFIVCAGLFQNCGRIGFNAEYGSIGNLSSLGAEACNQLLKQTYSRSYFPVLSVSCNRCHATGHGSTDLDNSFAGFMSKGVDLIDYKATHPHGDNGVNLSSQIPAMRSQWNQGQSDFASCIASASSGDNQLGFKFKLNEKVIPNIQNTLTNQNQWASVEWDLDSEGPSSVSTKFGAILKIEARYFLQQSAVVGIEFRNPSLRLKVAGKNVQVSGLQFYLDQTLQSDVTTYENVSAVVSSTTATMLASGAGTAFVYDPQAVASTLVGIEISNIRFATDPIQDPGTGGGGTPNPVGTTVTFNQLISTDATLGVFKNNCLGCHSGASPAKGLDLSNYSAAMANASLIQQRMNSTATPMPPSGVLPQANRDVVSRWINSGTPQ